MQKNDPFPNTSALCTKLPPYLCASSQFAQTPAIVMNERTVGAGAYTGPWAEVVFGPYETVFS